MREAGPVRKTGPRSFPRLSVWQTDLAVQTHSKADGANIVIMAFEDFDEKGRFLDSDQRIDARQMIGCGWAVRDVARHYALTELQLRRELGLPQFISEVKQDRQKSLFDDRGEA